MKAIVYDQTGKKSSEKDLPNVFNTNVRKDLIKRAVLTEQSWLRQPYGSNPLAGKRTSAHYHGKRHYRYTMMNREMSRIPRIHGSVGHLAFRARFAPHAVKGRAAHGPKAEKKWAKKINNKEYILALKSALAATAVEDLVKQRGHRVEINSPIIIPDDIEKTKQVFELLNSIGLTEEFARVKKKKVRAGKGTRRNRKYKKKKGPLFVVSADSKLLQSANNLPGVDVTTVPGLTVQMMAPGGEPGRFLIMTEKALEDLNEMFE